MNVFVTQFDSSTLCSQTLLYSVELNIDARCASDPAELAPASIAVLTVMAQSVP